MPPVRHRAVAQAALAATGARTAVTEDDAIHCITSHTVAHRVCIPNGWLGGQSRKVTHGNPARLLIGWIGLISTSTLENRQFGVQLAHRFF